MLEIDDVAVRRAGFALQVSGLRVAPLARVTVIGPSGGGKSTLMRAVAGLEPSARVRGLRWQGRTLDDAPPHRRPFGWMAQDLGLWPHLRADQHVAFARSRGRNASVGDADRQVLEQVGLDHRSHARPSQLSGGERQRLAFARVLAGAQAWALLDEPFSQLDPVIAHDLGRAFTALAQKRGLGVIQVSHHVRQPAGAEMFWVIEGGALVQAGHWQQLRESPETPWIARFVELQG
ncbi:MAG: ATP-binding cassette domain-containing protein [Rubrivivax sp.]